MRKGIFAVFWLGAAVSASAYVGPEALAVSRDGKTLYAAGVDSGSVVLVDVAGRRMTGSWKLKGLSATGVAAGHDGSVFVTASAKDGSGQVLKFAADGRTLASVPCSATPTAPALSPDGKTLYVARRFANEVVAFDAATLRPIAAYPVPREPVALAFGKEGRLLFAANFLPAGHALDDVVSSAVSVIEPKTGKVANTLLANGASGARGLAASPDGARIYVTHTLGRYQLPCTQLERGWMNTAAMTVFDGATGARVNTVLLDDADLGAANPWGVCVTPDGKHIAINHAGTRELSLIDAAALNDRLARVAAGETVTDVSKTPADVPNDLSFLVPFRRRVKLPGDGPRGIAAVGGSVFSALYFADELAVIEPEKTGLPVKTVALGPKVDLSQDRVRRGELLWNDGTMCFQQWQSCASCHPEGRSDALNWDQLNDGIGNPKQSKSMLYSPFTPPMMVKGVRPDFRAANRKGIRFIQFVVRPEEDAECLDAFVLSLNPVPSPYLVNGALSASARRGQALFNGKAECAMCHDPDAKGPKGERLFTDKSMHEMGLGVGNEKGSAFDTPTLTECWRTAPYLYDGRCRTIEEVLTTGNPDNRHGNTKGLTPDEIRDLAEYVRSL